MEAASETREDRGKYGTKRPPSRKPYTRISSLEVIHVLRLQLQGVSTSEIARIVKLSHQRVVDILRRSEPTTTTALGVLKANAHLAAEHWVRSFDKAAKRGEHRPMRDALIAVGVVAPDPQNQGVTVIVGSGDVVAMRQTHSTQSIDVNTLPDSTHNPALLPAIPHEPI